MDRQIIKMFREGYRAVDIAKKLNFTLDYVYRVIGQYADQCYGNFSK